MDVASLAERLQETAERHASFQAVAPPHERSSKRSKVLFPDDLQRLDATADVVRGWIRRRWRLLPAPPVGAQTQRC